MRGEGNREGYIKADSSPLLAKFKKTRNQKKEGKIRFLPSHKIKARPARIAGPGAGYLEGSQWIHWICTHYTVHTYTGCQ